MASKHSFETSWADQWDPQPLYIHPIAPDTGKPALKLSGKFEEKLDKVKVVASIGVDKVKTGAAVGLHWIKDKYKKATHK